MNLFRHTQEATFLERPNRFTLICRLNGEVVRAFLPNPGRMWELLLPGTVVYLEKTLSAKNKMPYTAVAVLKENDLVIVHTLKTNTIADYLIKESLVPGFKGAEVVRREVPEGHSRFDFLLRRGGKDILMEVKSCTLFGKQVAMFPDAITARGKRHIEELTHLSEHGRAGAVLFLIFSSRAKFFMPEYHTDLEFTRALLSARKRIAIIPLAVELRPDLSLVHKVRLLGIPWDIVKKEADDRGSYILILRLPLEARVEIGRLGRVQFAAGYYLYIGSAARNLSRRIERHRRLGKTKFWHIDYLRAAAEFRSAVPIRTADDLECEIAGALRGIAGWEIPGFGCSDCACHSHLFGMKEDPLKSARFISVLQYFRMDRLEPGKMNPLPGRTNWVPE